MPLHIYVKVFNILFVVRYNKVLLYPFMVFKVNAVVQTHIFTCKYIGFELIERIQEKLGSFDVEVLFLSHVFYILPEHFIPEIHPFFV